PALTFSPDGKTLAAGGFRSVSLLDAATGKALGWAVVPLGQHFSGIPFIAFSPDGKTFAWVTYSTCRVSDTATGKELGRFAFSRGGIPSLPSPGGHSLPTPKPFCFRRTGLSACGMLPGERSCVASGATLLTASGGAVARRQDAGRRRGRWR